MQARMSSLVDRFQRLQNPLPSYGMKRDMDTKYDRARTQAWKLCFAGQATVVIFIHQIPIFILIFIFIRIIVFSR